MIYTIKQKIRKFFSLHRSGKKINAIWWDSKNFGDALNPILIEHLSGSRPTLIPSSATYSKNQLIYTAIGSILQLPIFQNVNILRNTIIWGTGFIDESGRLQREPGQICAVRGPLTRNNILKSGIQCPEIYGDPALLYPFYYHPKINTKYTLGIVQHYIDKGDKYITNFKNNSEILFIDIEGPVNTVVDQICSCKYIASSSLHGIIMADAYRIPSVYLKFSDRVTGGNFKFRDYFSSVGRSETEPLAVNENTTIDDILDRISHDSIDIDLKELLDVCPFFHHENSRR